MQVMFINLKMWVILLVHDIWVFVKNSIFFSIFELIPFYVNVKIKYTDTITFLKPLKLSCFVVLNIVKHLFLISSVFFET